MTWDKRERRFWIIFASLCLLALLMPLPYYQSQELTCKPEQICPKKGWYLGPSLWQIVALRYFRLGSYFPQKSVEVNDTSLSPIPTAPRSCPPGEKPTMRKNKVYCCKEGASCPPGEPFDDGTCPQGEYLKQCIQGPCCCELNAKCD